MNFHAHDKNTFAALSTFLAAVNDMGPNASTWGGILALFQPNQGAGLRYQHGLVPNWGAFLRGGQAVVLIAGAAGVSQGAAFFAAALRPGVSIGNAHVNAAALSAAREVLAELDAANPYGISDYYLCGHSYGGAVAQIIAALLLARGSTANIQIFTEGAPRCGDADLSAVLYPIPGDRLMDVGDPVPFFPFHFEEAPFAVSLLGFLEAYNLSFWAQTPGGQVLRGDGSLYAAELPPDIVPIADVDLVAWLTNQSSSEAFEHDPHTYMNRLAPWIRDGPPEPIKGNYRAGGEVVFPLDQAVFNMGPVFGPEILERLRLMAFKSVYIPVQHRWKPVKVGLVWYATWESLLVVTCQSRSQAKSICKAGNKQLRVLQNASSVDHLEFGNALQLYLTAASSGLDGFSPDLIVT